MGNLKDFAFMNFRIKFIMAILKMGYLTIKESFMTQIGS